MTGKRRNDQKLRVGGAVLRDVSLKVQERAERPSPHDLFGYSGAASIDHRLGKPEFRLAVAAGRALEELGSRRHGASEGGLGKRVKRILER
jgi:hypothetical protein